MLQDRLSLRIYISCHYFKIAHHSLLHCKVNCMTIVCAGYTDEVAGSDKSAKLRCYKRTPLNIRCPATQQPPMSAKKSVVTAIRMLNLNAAIHMIELYCARLQCKLHDLPEDTSGNVLNSLSAPSLHPTGTFSAAVLNRSSNSCRGKHAEHHVIDQHHCISLQSWWWLKQFCSAS